MFICIRRDQHSALICTTALFYILAPTCFGSSLPSSGSFLDPSELLEIQIERVAYLKYTNIYFRYTTLTEGFPCFFLSCKANARAQLAKTGHGPHFPPPKFFFIVVYVPFSVFCVLYCCDRVSTLLLLLTYSMEQSPS
jgi:hypothetical protein